MNKKWLLIIAALSFLQAEQFMDPVNVSIYPEYYYHGVMVEIETVVEFDQDGVDILFIVPTSTDSIFLIQGIPSPDNKIIPLDLSHVKETNAVEFEITEPQFRLFIFFTPFEDGHDRSFTYSIGSNMEMKNVHLSIQEPVMAENFTIDRDISSESNDQHGIKFMTVHMDEISAGNVEKISIEYTNHTEKTTMENLRDQLSGTEEPNSNPRTFLEEKPKRHKLLLWEPLAILGVLSFIFGIMYYSKNKKRTVIEGQKNFCSSCGNKIEMNDKFCSKCGEKVS